MRRKELFYYVTWGSNVMRDVHWCVTVFYQHIENSNIANQIHRFTIDYGKFILKRSRPWEFLYSRQKIKAGLLSTEEAYRRTVAICCRASVVRRLVRNVTKLVRLIVIF